MSHIAFDAAKRRTGWAYRCLGGKWHTGVVSPADTEAMRGVLAAAIEHGVQDFFDAILEEARAETEGALA